MLGWPAPSRGKKRVSLEARYLITYAEKLQELAHATQGNLPQLIPVEPSSCYVSTANVIESHNSQLQFLNDVDNYKFDACGEATHT